MFFCTLLVSGQVHLLSPQHEGTATQTAHAAAAEPLKCSTSAVLVRWVGMLLQRCRASHA